MLRRTPWVPRTAVLPLLASLALLSPIAVADPGTETTPTPAATETVTAEPADPDAGADPSEAASAPEAVSPEATPDAGEDDLPTEPGVAAGNDSADEALKKTPSESEASCSMPSGVAAGAANARGTEKDLGRTYYFANTFTSKATSVITYGRANDAVLVGDWNGDGKDTLAVRRGNYYFFSNTLSGGAADVVIIFGRATDKVIVGDWNGDGADTLAVRRGNRYFFLNCLRGGVADVEVTYGRVSDQVLVGDWNGDGKDTLAVRRGKEYYVANSIKGGSADKAFAYGRASDEVYAGDWDGDGKDTLAVRRGNNFHVKNSLTGGSADRLVSYGRATDLVLVGDWDGDGKDTLGLRRPPVVKPAQTQFTFNLAWAGQPNNFFCGPTSGYMILRYKNAGNSKSTGASLTIENVATAMSTRRYGYTSFHDRKFQQGMNAWLGKNVYSTIHTPTPAVVQEKVKQSFSKGYPVAVDEQERRGGPHFNGHSNSTFSHIMVVTGYNVKTDAVQFADPGATLWGGAAQKFWYPSLATFTRNYLQYEYVNDGRQHIGIFTP
ncbi:Peptidase_C39 like family protein [Actinomyces ruminicola]|uniref:Peptidase_C39 like family protein n=1 Tax=Actinomyces ruminicola TaxID=332524 RepID=A0A1G9ZQ76_9ACTO|nr:Peptidase_C39 like family protein [Actinomyces ruminicola]